MKDASLAHENLIKAFGTIIHLRIAESREFSSNATFVTKDCKLISHEFETIVNPNANASIMTMFNDVEKDPKRF